MKDETGQTLAVITLIVLTVLTVAMAVSTRTISGLRQNTKQEESLRAYSAAEAGAEEALRKLQTGVTDPGSGVLSETDSQYSYTIESMGGGTSRQYMFRAEKDQAYQINLNGIGSGTSINIYWWRATSSVPEEIDSGVDCLALTSSYAALEYTYLAESPANNYLIREKNVYDSPQCLSRGNNFSTANVVNYNMNGIGTDIFTYSINPIILQNDVSRILRITTRYNAAWVLVETPVGTDLPSQGYIIKAKGISGESERNIEVSRSVASLPSIFDFAIFSGSGQPLQK